MKTAVTAIFVRTFPLSLPPPRVAYTRRRNPPLTTNPDKRHHFPAEIISHRVWLYFRLCLSYRDVEELMAGRGVTLTYEAVRYWCQKIGHAYTN